MITLDFLATSLIVVLLPGTGVIYTVATGLTRGWRGSLFAAVGCTAGILPHLLAGILGLAALLHASALAFQIVKFAGVAYLLYLAWTMWNESGHVAFDGSASEHGALQIATRGFLINILNPKLSIFFLAFLPQFLPETSESPVANMLLLGGVFMIMTLVVFAGYGFAAHAVRTWLGGSPGAVRALQRSFAGVFALLGARLAVAER